jgi:hypothetical protein
MLPTPMEWRLGVAYMALVLQHQELFSVPWKPFELQMRPGRASLHQLGRAGASPISAAGGYWVVGVAKGVGQKQVG